MYRRVGTLLAQLRLWRAARGVARQAPSDRDQLLILAAVLAEWSRRDQPLSVTPDPDPADDADKPDF